MNASGKVLSIRGNCWEQNSPSDGESQADSGLIMASKSCKMHKRQAQGGLKKSWYLVDPKRARTMAMLYCMEPFY